jgi:hypothetical protein
VAGCDLLIDCLVGMLVGWLAGWLVWLQHKMERTSNGTNASVLALDCCSIGTHSSFHCTRVCVLALVR